MNLKFGKNQKIELISIIISVISIITGFILSLEYLSWIAVILCGIPIIKECAEGLIKEFDLTADLLVSMGIIASIIIGEVFAAGEIAIIMAVGGFLEEYTEENTEEDAESTEDEESGEITTESVETTGNVITINAPVNVDVYVDGEYVGVAPISFPKTVGAHTVTLYKTGYLIKSYTIYASNNGKDDEYSFDELTSLIDALE